jgi:hypothetical protein
MVAHRPKMALREPPGHLCRKATRWIKGAEKGGTGLLSNTIGLLMPQVGLIVGSTRGMRPGCLGCRRHCSHLSGEWGLESLGAQTFEKHFKTSKGLQRHVALLRPDRSRLSCGIWPRPLLEPKEPGGKMKNKVSPNHRGLLPFLAASPSLLS